MKPIPFKRQTSVLTGGPGVLNLPTWSDGEQVVSCWRPSWRERLSILLFGRVWFTILSGRTHHPILLTASRDIFTETGGSSS